MSDTTGRLLKAPSTVYHLKKDTEMDADDVKLIIEIPKNKYKWIKEHQGVTDFQTTESLYDSIYNAIPLEDIIKDIEQTVITEQTEDSKWALGLRYSLKIIDKYTKKEN